MNIFAAIHSHVTHSLTFGLKWLLLCEEKLKPRMRKGNRDLEISLWEWIIVGVTHLTKNVSQMTNLTAECAQSAVTMTTINGYWDIDIPLFHTLQKRTNVFLTLNGLLREDVAFRRLYTPNFSWDWTTKRRLFKDKAVWLVDGLVRQVMICPPCVWLMWCQLKEWHVYM